MQSASAANFCDPWEFISILGFYKVQEHESCKISAVYLCTNHEWGGNLCTLNMFFGVSAGIVACKPDCLPAVMMHLNWYGLTACPDRANQKVLG